MGFSFASVVLSYFLIAGGTFFAALFAGRVGIHSEYLGYIVLALGGFLGGIVAARASKGSTIIEPGIGAVLLLGSVVALGVAGSGSSAHVVLLPSAMKAIALTAAASAGGGIAGAFVTEKLFADAEPAGMSWVLFVALATFGAGMIGTTIGALLSHGDAGPLVGMLALCCALVGIASGASARSRPLAASFLGGVLGLGGFGMLSIYVFRAMVATGGGESDKIPPELYAGMAVIAVGGGLAAMIGALIGWSTVGSKQ
ncbi:MAG: hypothetical protein JO257_30140 [Deltaproteobacteria bacterium]|nr:hypothetical protein [Deltaproteobacteria bacterium]